MFQFPSHRLYTQASAVPSQGPPLPHLNVDQIRQHRDSTKVTPQDLQDLQSLWRWLQDQLEHQDVVLLERGNGTWSQALVYLLLRSVGHCSPRLALRWQRQHAQQAVWLQREQRQLLSLIKKWQQPVAVPASAVEHFVTWSSSPPLAVVSSNLGLPFVLLQGAGPQTAGCIAAVVACLWSEWHHPALWDVAELTALAYYGRWMGPLGRESLAATLETVWPEVRHRVSPQAETWSELAVEPERLIGLDARGGYSFVYREGRQAFWWSPDQKWRVFQWSRFPLVFTSMWRVRTSRWSPVSDDDVTVWRESGESGVHFDQAVLVEFESGRWSVTATVQHEPSRISPVVWPEAGEPEVLSLGVESDGWPGVQTKFDLCPGTLLRVPSTVHPFLEPKLWYGRAGHPFLVGQQGAGLLLYMRHRAEVSHTVWSRGQKDWFLLVTQRIPAGSEVCRPKFFPSKSSYIECMSPPK